MQCLDATNEVICRLDLEYIWDIEHKENSWNGGTEDGSC